jgi:hypothetical protein
MCTTSHIEIEGSHTWLLSVTYSKVFVSCVLYITVIIHHRMINLKFTQQQCAYIHRLFLAISLTVSEYHGSILRSQPRGVARCPFPPHLTLRVIHSLRLPLWAGLMVERIPCQIRETSRQASGPIKKYFIMQ